MKLMKKLFGVHMGEKFVLCKESLGCVTFNNSVQYQMFCTNNS